MPGTAVHGADDALQLRDISTKARDNAKASDCAGKNKSFPILKPADVAAAAKSIGRAGPDNYSTEKLKSNIIRIARRKGASFVAQLPKAWRDEGKAEKTAAVSPFIGLIELEAVAEGQPRTSWAQVLRTGDFYDPRYGDFSITTTDLASILRNFKTGKYPVAPTRLCVDYNHGTSRPDSAEEGKSAGWVLDLELRDDNNQLWAHVEWTDEAAGRIEKKEYQFTSATIHFEYTNSNGGEDIGPTLQAFAVTNRPVIHGMEPLTLMMAHPGAVRLGSVELDDEAAEALFSYDEQRRRIQAALTACYGVGGSSYEYGCRGVYLEALFDGYAIYCEYDGNKYRVNYTLASDGTVTFDSEPVEVRVSYEPLTAADSAEEQNMSKTIKVKDAKGNDVELAQDTVVELAKTHAPKDEPVELSALKQTVETQGATILSLQKSNESLELAARKRDAEAAFDTLLRAGKVDPKQKDTLVKLALANNEMFTELTASLPVIREIGTSVGSEGDNTQKSEKAGKLDLAIADELKANPKLTKEQAYASALDKNPSLYEG